VYTFGQPMVGNQKFVEFMKGKFKQYSINYIRAVNYDDLVPRLPFQALDYRHFGKMVLYDTNFEQKIVHEDPEENYFAVLSFMERQLKNAKDAGRSLINAFTSGPENRGRWLQRSWRNFKQWLFPGVSAHLSDNYVDREIPIVEG
ncbi:unnamed protein product, partial [Ilex paraguariensis]